MTLILFVFILGIIIFIHELGHFIFAKRAKIYVYEFALGMGPQIFSFKRKNDETIYSIRLFPIGGFVSMAGEEVNEKENIPEEKKFYNRPWKDRFFTIVAGVVFNFIMAWLLLFLVALVNGAPGNKPIIKETLEGYPISETDLKQGDVIVRINQKRIHSIDRLMLELHVSSGKEIEISYLRDETEKKIKVKPVVLEEDGQEVYRYGFLLENQFSKGLLSALSFAFTKSYNLIEQMALVISYLFQGVLSLDSLSGPVGIFSVVGESAQAGFISVVFLIALISINVGFINLLPLPALDGGRLWFLLIEKIKGSPLNPKIENIIHQVGFFLLIGLLIYITFNDILNLGK